MGKYRTIGTDLNRNYRNDLNLNFEEIDKDIKTGVAETKRVETETKETIDNIVGGGFIEGLENARDNANASAINADTKAALANTKADYANTQGLYAKEQGDYAKLQGTYAKDKAVEADTAANKAIAETSNLDVLKIAVTDATQAAGVATGKANASATAADTATGKANTAAGKADTATGKADVAADNANAKATLAQQAADKANTEATGLETLKLNVTTATGAANDATLSANTATSKADASSVAADASAANADTEAANAEIQATHALTQGDYAKEQGDYSKIQGDHAKTEGDKAALESADLSGLKTAATVATDDALTAAELATTESTGLASMKDAVTAATLSAEGASTQATEQANYAKLQGDYAKIQGDLVQGVFDAGLVASVNSKTGAVVLGAADVGAEPSVVGKGLSTEDFTTAEKDKLATVEDGANNYTLPDTLPAEIITEIPTKRFVTDEKIADWDSKETTAGAQQKADLVKKDLDVHIEDYMPHDSGLNEYASLPDENGVYKQLELKRSDGTLYMKSVLSIPNPEGQYTKAVWTFYGTNGITTALIKTWTIAYNDDGLPVTKEVA